MSEETVTRITGHASLRSIVEGTLPESSFHLSRETAQVLLREFDEMRTRVDRFEAVLFAGRECVGEHFDSIRRPPHPVAGFVHDRDLGWLAFCELHLAMSGFPAEMVVRR